MFLVLAETATSEVASSTLTMVEVLQDYLNDFLRMLPTLAIALIVLIVFIILSKVGRKSAQRISAGVIDDPSLQNLAGTFVAVVLTVIGVFAAATIVFPGLRAGDLIAVLGLSSVAIGFAFKDIFQNFLAGILLLMQRPFVVGDQIEVSDFAGTVEHINVRSTSIRSYNGQLIVMPNADIYSSPVTVNTAEAIRRSVFETGVGYGEDIEEARQIIAESIEDCDLLLDEPAPQVLVTGHGDSSVDLAIVYWTKSDRRSETLARDQVATTVKYALDEAEIEIPYPYRTVEFFDKTEKTD